MQNLETVVQDILSYNGDVKLQTNYERNPFRIKAVLIDMFGL